LASNRNADFLRRAKARFAARFGFFRPVEPEADLEPADSIPLWFGLWAAKPRFPTAALAAAVPTRKS
jgi:hypothetical protein